MYRITEKQFNEMPSELQELYEKLPNPSRDEVVGLFPNSKAGGAIKEHKRDISNINFANSHLEWGGFDDSGSAARFFYCAKASKRERNRGCEGLEEGEVVRQGLAGEHNNPTHKNNHPTVKPIALMEYLVKLVSKEGHTVLDPFMGSGSTGIACKKLGREFIGIEMESDYCKIAEARIGAVQTVQEKLYD